MATLSSILAWSIPHTEESGRLQFTGAESDSTEPRAQAWEQEVQRISDGSSHVPRWTVTSTATDHLHSCHLGGPGGWNKRPPLDQKSMLSNLTSRTSLVALMIKNPPAVQETWVQSQGWDSCVHILCWWQGPALQRKPVMESSLSSQESWFY